MITVEEALEALFQETPLLPEETLGFPQANMRFCAADVYAPYEHPLFDQSAVDGYAFAWDDTVTAWELAGEVPAGKAFSGTLSKGQCVRIFTGGMMPQGTDTVVIEMEPSSSRTAIEVSHRVYSVQANEPRAHRVFSRRAVRTDYRRASSTRIARIRSTVGSKKSRMASVMSCLMRLPVFCSM